MTTQNRKKMLQVAAALGAAAVGKSVSAKDGGIDSNVLFPVPSISIPIVGSEKVFPVRRIYCIGRNYAATP